jgi:hypothetical protein
VARSLPPPLTMLNGSLPHNMYTLDSTDVYMDDPQDHYPASGSHPYPVHAPPNQPEFLHAHARSVLDRTRPSSNPHNPDRYMQPSASELRLPQSQHPGHPAHHLAFDPRISASFTHKQLMESGNQAHVELWQKYISLQGAYATAT